MYTSRLTSIKMSPKPGRVSGKPENKNKNQSTDSKPARKAASEEATTPIPAPTIVADAISISEKTQLDTQGVIELAKNILKGARLLDENTKYEIIVLNQYFGNDCCLYYNKSQRIVTLCLFIEKTLGEIKYEKLNDIVMAVREECQEQNIFLCPGQLYNDFESHYFIPFDFPDNALDIQNYIASKPDIKFSNTNAPGLNDIVFKPMCEFFRSGQYGAISPYHVFLVDNIDKSVSICMLYLPYMPYLDNKNAMIANDIDSLYTIGTLLIPTGITLTSVSEVYNFICNITETIQKSVTSSTYAAPGFMPVLTEIHNSFDASNSQSSGQQGTFLHACLRFMELISGNSSNDEEDEEIPVKEDDASVNM